MFALQTYSLTVYQHAVLLKLKLVPVFKFTKNTKHTLDRKFVEVYVCENLSKQSKVVKSRATVTTSNYNDIH